MSSQAQTLERTMNHTELATRFGGTILEAWGDIVFLVREPNRFGQFVYRIRLIFAYLAPYRYGDYESEAYAKDLFHKTVEFVENQLNEIPYAAQDLVTPGERDGKSMGGNELGNFSVEY